MGWNKKIRHLMGVRRLHLSGSGTGYLLSNLRERAIDLQDVEGENGSLSFTLAEKDAARVLKTVENLRLRVEGEERYSWKTLGRSLWRERFRALGALLFVLILLFVSTRVWVVEFQGIRPGDEERVLALAGDYGVSPGQRLSQMQVQELLIELQKSTGPYSFAGAEINGAKLKISLREGIPAPEMDANSQRPAHLVAGVSGTVEELIVLRGEAAVKKGDRVQKGDVLVRGVLTALWDGRFVDFTNAAAIVHIAEDVEVEGEVDLAEIQLLPTGKSKSRLLGEIRDFTICLQYGKIVYNTYIEETQNLKLPGWMEKLGLGLRIETLKEARSAPAVQSENQAIRKLAEGFLNPGETLGRVEVLWQEARGNIRRYGLKLQVIRQDVEQVYLTQEEMAAIRANTKPR